jgi:acetyltransferase-like isoleucine patch superfamily enzyme
MLFIKTFFKYKNIISIKWHLLKFNLLEKPLFKSISTISYLGKYHSFINHKYISIGSNFTALQRLRIEAIDKFGQQIFKPNIIIGNNVSINTDVHIGCINKVVIGNNVLMASRIYISDHSHGDVSSEAIQLPPNSRDLVSKGPVVIADNVWIGEGVCIFPNVSIGENCIIGANAVVTKSFTKNSVIAGVPARLIKTI